MTSQTAHAAVSIQYPAPIQTPFFGEFLLPKAAEKQYVVWLSDFRPEYLIRTPTFVLPRWTASPSPFESDEFLDWDLPFGEVPKRPSGAISVMLKHVGRGEPVNITEYWD